MGNIELLKKTKEQIILFPEKHDQKTWHCSTSMCIAGHASVLAGAKLEVFYPHDPDAYTYLVDPEGNEVFASVFAMEALDMTEEERQYLFYCLNDEIALKRVDHVIQLWEEGKTLDDVSEDEYVPWDEDEES